MRYPARLPPWWTASIGFSSDWSTGTAFSKSVRQAAGYLHRMADAAKVRLELPAQTVAEEVPT